jgi:hypothetical protein
MKEMMFSPKEVKILELYRNPNSSGLGRAKRLSSQYLLAAGIFTSLAIAYQPWYAFVAYLVFVAFVVVRLPDRRPATRGCLAIWRDNDGFWSSTRNG